MKLKDIKHLGTKLGVDWKKEKFTPKQLLKGYRVELEHSDVTKGDPEKTVMIALAHLRERTDYYEKLEACVEDGSEIKAGTKVASTTEDIWKIWEKTREYIDDEEVLEEFDDEFDACDTDEEAEELFIEVIIEYMNEEVVPEDGSVEFGEHKDKGEIGFWMAGEVLSNEEDEDENEDEEEYGDEEGGRQEEKTAEILDGEGNVVAETGFVVNSEYEDKDIKTICMHCKKHLKGPKNSTVVSHGICEECFKKYHDDEEDDEEED